MNLYTARTMNSSNFFTAVATLMDDVLDRLHAEWNTAEAENPIESQSPETEAQS